MNYSFKTKSKTLLLTGSSGFLGKEVIKILYKKYKFFEEVRKKNKNKIYCDLNNIKKIRLILEKLKPDIIVNLAAEVNLSNKTKKMFNVNSICPKIFARYCKKNNKYLVQASTVLVHKKSEIYNYNSKLDPENYYGKTKLLAEKKIKETGCRYAIIRFVGIFGHNGPNHLGINNTIKDAIKKKIISFKGNSKIKRNYIYVGDAAKVIKKCIDNKLKGTFYASGQIQTFEEMIKKINKIIGLNSPIKFFTKKKDDMDQICISSRNFNFRSFSTCIKEIKNSYMF